MLLEGVNRINVLSSALSHLIVKRSGRVTLVIPEYSPIMSRISVGDLTLGRRTVFVHSVLPRPLPPTRATGRSSAKTSSGVAGSASCLARIRDSMRNVTDSLYDLRPDSRMSFFKYARLYALKRQFTY